ncbi:MAG: helix-turn-helix transcriptional regulator [Candidatus Cryptobacteroides sp.]
MDISTSFFITAVVAATLSALLFFIKVPSSPYTRRLGNTKNAIAACFAIASAIFTWTWFRLDFEWTDTFPAMMTFIVTALSSTILSFSLLNLLSATSSWTDKSWLNIMVDVIFAFALIYYYDHPAKWVKITAFSVSIALFITQCIIHIIIFNKAYINALRNLEIYYDEDEEHKIKWIRFCYAMMMLTQMFVLVYLCLPSTMMKIYVLFYALFMLYFAANFISFLGSHKLLLDAFAYKALSGEGRPKKVRKVTRTSSRNKASNDELIYTDKDLQQLDESLSKWVEDGRYKEYDKTREEIAEELKTSKELLQIYFADKGLDFRTWRTKLRIEDAKQMLLTSRSLSVNAIAERCGFSDRSNFHRQFQKLVGCSPKQWRESDGKFTSEDAPSRTDSQN